jgi:hypothetical protein
MVHSKSNQQTPANSKVQYHRFSRGWPHLLVYLTGAYLFHFFRFGPTWGIREFLGITSIWWAWTMLLDRRWLRDLQSHLRILGEHSLRMKMRGLASLLLLCGIALHPSLSQIIVATLGAILSLALQGCYFRALGLPKRLARKSDCFIWLLLAGLFLIAPYASRTLVGSGDAEHYARQLADFVTQLRQGEFPIFAGQSRFAFAGNVHPLRTAPYFQYAGGLVDILTGHSLTPYALQNLLIVLSHLAALFGMFLALTMISGQGRQWACSWLALLFISSPGVMALIYSGDMIASWMVLPWLPWLLFGWWLTWDKPHKTTGLIWQAGSLAMIWLAHAPIAIWLTMLTAANELVRLVIVCRNRQAWLRAVGAGVLCGLLCQYVFVSVITMDVPENPYLSFALQHGIIQDVLKDGWTGFFRIVSGDSNHLLQDLFLSPGLLVAAALGLLGLGARTPLRWFTLFMLTAIISGTVLLIPNNGLSEQFWSHLPSTILTITEKWPMQRFYLILSALGAITGAIGLAHPWFSRERTYRALLIVLMLCTTWSLIEARKFIHRGELVTRTADNTRRSALPENNKLSKYSYEMWGRLPRNFSFGHMDPAMENYLLDESAQHIEDSNLRQILRQTTFPSPPDTYRYTSNSEGGYFSPAVTLAPGHSCVLRFAFWDGSPKGTLLITGRRINRRYDLPSSGEEAAFGAQPGQSRGLAITNKGTTDELITVRYVRADKNAPIGHFADMDVIPYDEANLLIRLLNLNPYQLQVNATQSGWVETPKLLIPGYKAYLDGQPVKPSRSPDGLLMLPVTAGEHQISLSYEGPIILKFSFWANLTALLVFPAALILRHPRCKPLPILATKLHSLPSLKLEHLGYATPVLIAMCLGAYAFLPSENESTLALAGNPASISMKVQLPVGLHETYEPLLTIRDSQGNTTTVVVFYQDDRHIRIGARKNGVLKIMTDAWRTSYFPEHEIQIFIGLLLKDSDRDIYTKQTDEDWIKLRRSLQVKFNQHQLWETELDDMGAGPYQITTGRSLGGSAPTTEIFHGKIVKVTGLPSL